ncbi:regulatory factor, effector binding domain-containing protein [Haematococcus lacustris]
MSGATAFVVLVALVSLGSGVFAGRSIEPSYAVRGDGDWEAPDFYRGKDGPIYDVMQTSDDLELRRYRDSKWVSINVTGLKWDEAYKTATKELDEYWKGSNQPETKLDNTVPTFSILKPTGPERTLATDFTIEYFLPHELFDAPPAPSSHNLEIVSIPSFDVWVKAFGGYVSESTVVDQAYGLMQELEDKGIQFDSSNFGVAIYDEPLRVVGRHNEIWITAGEAPSAAAKVAFSVKALWQEMCARARQTSQRVMALAGGN